jgi:hypothetical protein
MVKKTEFTFELEETYTLKQGGRIPSEFCPKCCQITEMASPEVIALATGTSEREIFRLIESGKIHYMEDDRVYACTRCIQIPAIDIERTATDPDEG